MTGICRNQRLVPVAAGGMDDHAHLLFHLPPTIALSHAVLLIKINSSQVDERAWQKFFLARGFSAFSVSESILDKVTNYIRTQEKHHRKMSFEEEIRILLEKNNIQYDPKYFLS